MKLQLRILAFAVAMTLSLAAHAHDCSGGTNGGMDATGNQCNDDGASVTTVATTAPAGPSAAQTVAPRTVATESNRDVALVASNDGTRAKSGHHATKKHRHSTG